LDTAVVVGGSEKRGPLGTEGPCFTCRDDRERSPRGQRAFGRTASDGLYTAESAQLAAKRIQSHLITSLDTTSKRSKFSPKTSASAKSSRASISGQEHPSPVACGRSPDLPSSPTRADCKHVLAVAESIKQNKKRSRIINNTHSVLPEGRFESCSSCALGKRGRGRIVSTFPDAMAFRP
jgi:hypothetical protein